MTEGVNFWDWISEKFTTAGKKNILTESSSPLSLILRTLSEQHLVISSVMPQHLSTVGGDWRCKDIEEMRPPQ